MARVGRKRKQGKRTKSGQLSRAGEPSIVKGSERAQAMQALYGQDGADAIGRAYRAGLLGDDNEAKALLDVGRKMARIYWRAYEVGPVSCTLGDKDFGTITATDNAKAKAAEEWLERNLGRVGLMGTPMRKAFDQMVINPMPDHGPRWLDRLCWQARRNMDMDPADISMLALAIEGLQCCDA